MSERKRSVLTRGETMFWESAYVIAVVIGMFALVAGSQVKLNLPLVLLLSMAPWTIVWVARKLWKPRPVPRDDDGTRPDPYKASDPAVDDVYQSRGSQVWYAFAVGAVLALVATLSSRVILRTGTGSCRRQQFLAFSSSAAWSYYNGP